MKYGKMISLLMTAVLALAAVVISTKEPQPQPTNKVNIPVSAEIEMDGRREQITCWEEEPGDYVVFLPSGADLSDVTLSHVPDMQLLLNQQRLETETDCGDFELDVSYGLSWTTEANAMEGTLTFLQSAQLPSFHVDVLSGSMDIIHETKGNQESGSLRLYSAVGSLEYSGQIESLKGRGNSSWLRGKKPYSLTLAREADLLGMGRAKEWILLANAMDPSHLRNKAAYDLAAATGMGFAPECQWVDLYLNGEYVGVYLLSERNEIHPERLNLPLTGSFLVSRESKWRLTSQNYPHIITDSGAALRIHDSGLTETDLYQIWQSAENAILAEDGIDPLTGKHWTQLIDLDSWVIEYLMGEVFGNADAGTISAYFYKDGRDPSGKIYAGPVWDYDLSMGSKGAGQLKHVKAFFSDKRHIWDLEDTTWSYWLNRKPEFHNRVKELYQTIYRPLVQELLDSGLDDYTMQVYQGAQLDQRRWATEDAQEEKERIHQYLTERLAFLDSVWIENTLYYKVLVIRDPNNSFCHAVLPGETIPKLSGYYEEWGMLGWFDAETGEPFDDTQPIYKDRIVYMKMASEPEEEISRLQVVPLVVCVLLLLIIVLLDAERCRFRKAINKKSIAKQNSL